MVREKYANAMSEVLHYLKGVRKEDKDKIPKKLIEFLEANASKEYICSFDYTKPLKELKLLDETRGFIGIICFNYWCDTEEKKNQFKNRMCENENIYQEELREKYDPDNIFKNKNNTTK